MITEINSLASDSQALGTAAVADKESTYVLDFAAQAPVYDGSLRFVVMFEGPLSGGSSVQAKIQHSADNSTWTDWRDSGAVALADLPKDGVVLDEPVTEDMKGKRYWRVSYTTKGTFASGASPVATAGLFTERAPHAVKAL